MKQDNLVLIAAIILSGSLALTMFIFWGQLILNFLKIPALPKLKPAERNFNAAQSKSAKQRRKIETNPGIMCSFPIYQESRPEAPLS